MRIQFKKAVYFLVSLMVLNQGFTLWAMEEKEQDIIKADAFAFDTWVRNEAHRSQDRNLDLNRILDDLPINIELQNPRLLLIAVNFCSCEVVAELLKKEARVGISDLSAAARRGDVRILRALLQTEPKEEFLDHALRQAAL